MYYRRLFPVGTVYEYISPCVGNATITCVIKRYVVLVTTKSFARGQAGHTSDEENEEEGPERSGTPYRT